MVNTLNVMQRQNIVTKVNFIWKEAYKNQAMLKSNKTSIDK